MKGKTLLFFCLVLHSVGLASYLRVVGNKLYDDFGNEVRLTGVNWFGFETGNYVAHGLWSRDYKSMLMQIRDLGFNCIRIPFSNEMLRKTAPTGIQINAYGNDAYAQQKGIKLYPQAPEGFTGINLDLQGLTPLEILDKIIEEAGKLGLKVILDNHSRKADGYMNETLWYTQDFSEEQWIADWVFLAERYKNNPTVIGADLNNEPHGNTGMGMKPPATWGYDLPQYAAWAPNTDWAAAAERCGNAILQVNPNWLIIVEGVEEYRGECYWWGGNLMGVSSRPINLIIPEKLVYSPHEYGPEVYNQPWFSDPSFPNNMIPIWRKFFGYIYDNNICHLLVGEFGIKNRTNTVAYTWFTEFMKYMGDKYSWTFWCFNPNSGDTGGILQDDWVSVHEWKMEVLRPYLAPFISTATASIPADRPPVVNILSPSNGAIVLGNVIVSISANDDKALTKFELYLNQTKLYEVILSTKTFAYSYSLDTTQYSNSTYTITAKVFDNLNQYAQTSISIRINNPTTPSQTTPETYIRIIHPLDNQVLSGVINISVEASSDIHRVEVFLSTTQILSTQQQPYYSFDLNTKNFSNGNYVLKAYGYTQSTTVVSQINVIINNVEDDLKPTLQVNLSTKTFTDTFSATITVSDDFIITKIEVFLNNILIASTTVNRALFTWQPRVDLQQFPSGTYNLVVVVYDNKQQTNSFTTSIVINNSPQTLEKDQTENITWNQTSSYKNVYFLSLNFDGKNDKVFFSSNNVLIFSPNGKLIKELDTNTWEGYDSQGRLVPSGVYYFVDQKNKQKGLIIVSK